MGNVKKGVIVKISETTKKLYWSHTNRFLRWLSEQKMDRNVPKNWADALDKLTKDCTKKTWRLYRNATFWGTNELFGNSFSNQYYVLTNLLVKPSKKQKKLLKRIDYKVLKNILVELAYQNTMQAKQLADIIITIVATGLRPTELSTAKLNKSDHHYVLVVRNAKYRPAEDNIPARANGMMRSLIIEHDNIEIITSIKNSLNYCHGRRWSSMAANINRRFRRLIKKLITEKRITKKWQKLRLYDFRHQFSANAKALLNTESGEVAAAMGHRSVETAVSHYGQRKFANAGGLLVRPSKESVEAVDHRSVIKFKNTLANNQNRKNAKETDKTINKPDNTTPQSPLIIPEKRD